MVILKGLLKTEIKMLDFFIEEKGLYTFIRKSIIPSILALTPNQKDSSMPSPFIFILW